MGVDFFKTDKIILDGIFVCCIKILTNVDTEYATEFAFLDLLYKKIHTLVVETQTVNHCLGFFNAEYTWLGVSWLWTWCYGADFDKSKTNAGQCVDVFTVFIHASRHADGVGEFQAHDIYRLNGGGA